VSTWELTNIAARLVLPPGGLILLALLGLAVARTRARLGTGLALASLVALYALSIPVVSTNLLRSLETPYSDPATHSAPGAIVVLGGGLEASAPEYGGDSVSSGTLVRLRYAARLQRRTGKPILVTGGNPASVSITEGEQMKNALREFGASAKWMESASNNTFENAKFSRQMLKKAGVQSVYLVTHAWHMPRAQMAFERAGLHVVPAPTGYHTVSPMMLLDFVPNAHSLGDSYLFFHEVLGAVWYRLKFDLGR